MPLSLTESTLCVHNFATDYENFKAGLPELHRVETWVTSHAGEMGWSSITRPRTASVSSASSIAVTLPTVCTNAGSQVSKGFICGGGLEEENEKCEYPNQDRNILGKRARQVAESRVKKSTSVPPPTKKPRVEGGSKHRTKDTDSDASSQVNEGIVWRYGGFVDSDEDDDCENRALLLGETNNVSLAITSGGTTTIVPPPARRTYEPRVERPKHRIKDPKLDLPRGAHDNNDWYKKFIPTYKKFLGTRDKPWIIDEDESIAVLQVIWRAVYPHIDYVIDANCLAYRMANLRIDNWEDSFDLAAIDMFKSAYKDLGYSSKVATSNASSLLQNNRFMYAERTGETPKEYRGLFRSAFILELIAGHYDAISGAIRIPEFEPAFSRDQQKLVKSLETRLRTMDADSREALEIAVKLDTMRMYPKGALALCITAVERALGVFAPAGGAFFSGPKHHRWIKKVQKYSDYIERKLRPGLMEDIVLRACPLMDTSTNISSISVQVLNDSDDEESTSTDI